MNNDTSPVNTGRSGPPTPGWNASPAPTEGKATDRRRAVVGSLPDWEPLPPGEILVQRKLQ